MPHAEAVARMRNIFTGGAASAAAVMFATVLMLVLPSGIAAQSSHAGNGLAIVELFTSEGCSSCPPADAMLEQISREMPEVVLLSEHVTYWNNLGWADPFSSDTSTERQEEYARRFRSEGPYTPQMVVNGTHEFVGGARGPFLNALKLDAAMPRPTLTVSTVTAEKHMLRVAVKLTPSSAAGRLVAVLVQNDGHAHVLRGENGGRTLTHVDIARDFHDAGKVVAGAPFTGEVSFNLPANGEAAAFHIVVFLQKDAGGPILAAGSSIGS